MKEYTSTDTDDYEFDEIKGEAGKKPKMAVLNKGRISKYEMDELFLGEE